MQDPVKSPSEAGAFPHKLFYKIGEVSRIVDVESYVLRYWEAEFPFLSPRKSKAGQRVYTRRDIDLILQIKRLLYEEKYTIDGVRRRLRRPEVPPEDKGVSVDRVVSLVRERLKEILGSL